MDVERERQGREEGIRVTHVNQQLHQTLDFRTVPFKVWPQHNHCVLSP